MEQVIAILFSILGALVGVVIVIAIRLHNLHNAFWMFIDDLQDDDGNYESKDDNEK